MNFSDSFAYNAGDLGLIPGLGRTAGEGIGYPLQYSWASLVAQLVKSLPAIWETWVWSLGWEDPLDKGMATHSNILAWRIPRTTQSMGSQRVGLDWATFTSLQKMKSAVEDRKSGLRWRIRGCQWDGMSWGGVPETGTFEQKQEAGEGGNVWKSGESDRGDSLHRGPEAGPFLRSSACLRKVFNLSSFQLQKGELITESYKINMILNFNIYIKIQILMYLK